MEEDLIGGLVEIVDNDGAFSSVILSVVVVCRRVIGILLVHVLPKIKKLSTQDFSEQKINKNSTLLCATLRRYVKRSLEGLGKYEIKLHWYTSNNDHIYIYIFLTLYYYFYLLPQQTRNIFVHKKSNAGTRCYPN